MRLVSVIITILINLFQGYHHFILQVNTGSSIGKFGYSLDKDTIHNLFPAQYRTKFHSFHKYGGKDRRIAVIPASKVKDLFIDRTLKIKSTLDELPGGHPTEADPFIDPGCLAWVMKTCADNAKLVSDIDSWKKCQYESKKRALEESGGGASSSGVGRGGEGEGERATGAEELEDNDNVENMDT